MPKNFFRFLTITSCIAASVYGFDESTLDISLNGPKTVVHRITITDDSTDIMQTSYTNKYGEASFHHIESGTYQIHCDGKHITTVEVLPGTNSFVLDDNTQGDKTAAHGSVKGLNFRDNTITTAENIPEKEWHNAYDYRNSLKSHILVTPGTVESMYVNTLTGSEFSAYYGSESLGISTRGSTVGTNRYSANGLSSSHSWFDVVEPEVTLLPPFQSLEYGNYITANAPIRYNGVLGGFFDTYLKKGRTSKPVLSVSMVASPDAFVTGALPDTLDTGKRGENSSLGETISQRDAYSDLYSFSVDLSGVKRFGAREIPLAYYFSITKPDTTVKFNNDIPNQYVYSGQYAYSDATLTTKQNKVNYVGRLDTYFNYYGQHHLSLFGYSDNKNYTITRSGQFFVSQDGGVTYTEAAYDPTTTFIDYHTDQNWGVSLDSSLTNSVKSGVEYTYKQHKTTEGDKNPNEGEVILAYNIWNTPSLGVAPDYKASSNPSPWMDGYTNKIKSSLHGVEFYLQKQMPSHVLELRYYANNESVGPFDRGMGSGELDNILTSVLLDAYVPTSSTLYSLRETDFNYRSPAIDYFSRGLSLSDDVSLGRTHANLGLRWESISSKDQTQSQTLYDFDSILNYRVGVSHDVKGDKTHKFYTNAGTYTADMPVYQWRLAYAMNYISKSNQWWWDSANPIGGGVVSEISDEFKNLVAAALLSNDVQLTREDIQSSGGFPASDAPQCNPSNLWYAPSSDCWSSVRNYSTGFVDGEQTTADSYIISQNLKPAKIQEFTVGYDLKPSYKSPWILSSYVNYKKLVRGVAPMTYKRVITQTALATADNPATYSYSNSSVDAANPGSPIEIANADGSTTTYDNFELEVTTLDADSNATTTTSYIPFPKAKRNFTGLTFVAEKEWDGNLSVLGNITFSNTRGNYEGVFDENYNSSSTAFGSSDLKYPDYAENAYGYLPNHRRLNTKLLVRKAITPEVSGSTFINVISPVQYSCYGEHPSNIEGSSTYVPYAATPTGRRYHYCSGVASTRGTAGQGDWVSNLNLMLSYESKKPLPFLSALPSSGFTAYVSWTNVFNDVAEVDAFEISGESHSDYGTGSFTVDRDMFLEPEHYHLLGRVSVGLKLTI